MIGEPIKAVGKFLLEIKSTYPLDAESKDTDYKIDHYLFVPDGLDINPETYPKYLFYRDLQTYIRFKTPEVPLRNFVTGPDSRFEALRETFSRLADSVSPTTRREYENSIKLFCCVLRSALRAHIEFIRAQGDGLDTSNLLKQYVYSCTEILHAYRGMREIITLPTIGNDLFSIYVFCDEYISLLIEQDSYELLDILKTRDFEERAVFQKQLLELIRAELSYRREKKYPSIPSHSQSNEELVYRETVIRRYTESILVLDTRMRPEGRMTEQIIYGVAAGLAMAFATGIVFFAQERYGNFTSAFFVALVIMYIFKDRIKELTRLYLSSKILNRFFDHRVTICGGSARVPIGYSKESFRFVEESSLEPEILHLRNRDRITTLENEFGSEQIILYQKKICIRSKGFDQVYRDPGINSINDITRINIARLLRKLDQPKKSVYVLEDKGYKRVTAQKVYHLSLVTRYSSGDSSYFRRFRVVVSRSGIKRIEEIE